VRRVIAGGIIGMPITFFLLSQMQGSFWQFLGITLLQACLGAFTISSVYSRLVAERFVLACGISDLSLLCAVAGALVCMKPARGSV
jgi:hypothetical protein